MNFAISWVLGLFKKPEVEVTFDKAQIKPAEAWPFPVEKPKRKAPAKKRTVKRTPAKKVVAKKATTVAKKKTGAKK
jgi:hypothetical protein